MPYSDQKILEIGNFYNENGEEAALKKYKIKHATLDRLLRTYKNKSQDKYDFERIEEPGQTVLSLTSYELKTVDELLAYSKIDTSIWEVTKVVTNAWGSEKNPNFQIKAWLKRKDNIEIDLDTTCQYLIDNISKYSKPAKIKYEIDKEGLLWEIGLVDHHVGAFAWHKEVGFNYDIKIAKKIYEQSLEFLIQQVKGLKINKILYHFGQDFFNVNSQFNTTVRGTAQDEEGRWQKTFDIGLLIHFEAIKKLSQIAPVHAICVVGNHDEERIYYAGAALKGMFANDANVFIDNEPKGRKYYRYGENLLGFTHLTDIKVDRLFNLMPVEAKEDWSKTKNWEWHCGHPHHETKKILNLNLEEASIRVRTLPTLATIDAWHYKNGYLSQRETQSFLWHPTKGNIMQVNYKV